MHTAQGTQFLLAYQSDNPTDDDRDSFLSHFGGFMYRVAQNACRFWNLSQEEDVRDVVQAAHCKLLEPKKRFADCLCTAEQYIVGMVRNAAKQHFRFLSRLPECDDECLARQLDHQQKARLRLMEDFDAAMHGEGPDIQRTVEALYFEGSTLEEAASILGTNRFKLTRLREQFFARARVRLGVG